MEKILKGYLWEIAVGLLGLLKGFEGFFGEDGYNCVVE